MTLIVDGYNLLHAGNLFQKQLTREMLVNMIISYKSIKKHIIIIVFDGGDSFYQHEIQKNGITILFSGYGQTADDAIIALLKTQKNVSQKLLVSTDRALAEKAHDYNIISIDSAVFYQILMQRITENIQKNPVIKKRETIVKYNNNSSDELDQLMMGDPLIKKHESTEIVSIKKQSHKMSQKEKQIAEILEKL